MRTRYMVYSVLLLWSSTPWRYLLYGDVDARKVLIRNPGIYCRQRAWEHYNLRAYEDYESWLLLHLQFIIKAMPSKDLTAFKCPYLGQAAKISYMIQWSHDQIASALKGIVTPRPRGERQLISFITCRHASIP